MDHALSRFRDRLYATLKSRLPRLPGKTPKLRLPVWAWMIPTAFLLACFAHSGSQGEGRLRWLSENAPSESAWKDVLTRRGFSPIEDPAWREKAYAEMPEFSRLKATALISENRYWVALRTTGDWLYFRRSGHSGTVPGGLVVKRELWEPLGIGWAGIAVLDGMELPRLEPESPKKSAQTASWRDSRSLEF